MSLVHCDGFDYYTTAFLPAFWTSATAIAIDVTGGRQGSGAAMFDASAGSALAKSATWQTAGGFGRSSLGFAIKFTVMPTSEVAIVKLTTSTARVYKVTVTPNGSLVLYQDALVLALSSAGVVVSGQGIYIELQVLLQNGSSVTMRANGLTVGSSVASGVTGGENFTSVTLGGDTNMTGGRWIVDDFYVVDGHAESTISVGATVVNNAGFLGSVRVDAVFASQNGYFVEPLDDPSYTPWDFNYSQHYIDVREHPPDEDVTYEQTDVTGTYNAGSHQLDKYATYQFTHLSSRVVGFGRTSGGVAAPIYGLHWIGRERNDPTASTVRPTVRRVVDSTARPSTDIVALGTAQTLAAGFQYFEQFWDRDAISALASGTAAWTFNVVFLQPTVAP